MTPEGITLDWPLIRQALLLANFRAPDDVPWGDAQRGFTITLPTDAHAYRFIVGLTRALGSLDKALAAVEGAHRTEHWESRPHGVQLCFPSLHVEG